MMMYGQMPLPKKSLGFFRHLRPTLMYMYGFAHDFGAIVPKKRADMVGVYYIYVHVWCCT